MLDDRAFALPDDNRRWCRWADFADAGCIVAIPSTAAIRHREIFDMEGSIGRLGPQGSHLLRRFLRENAGSDPGFELLVALLDDNCPNAFDVSFELFLPTVIVIGFNQLAPHLLPDLFKCATRFVVLEFYSFAVSIKTRTGNCSAL
jgi:hypothetical protein